MSYGARADACNNRAIKVAETKGHTEIVNYLKSYDNNNKIKPY